MENILKNIVKQNNGYLTIALGIEAGASKYDVLQFVKKYSMDRVAHGLYASHNVWVDDMFVLQKTCPRVIFSHDTAYWLHGLSDREPFKICVTVPRGYNNKALRDEKYFVHTCNKEYYDIGITNIQTFTGCNVMVYDKERCLCDLIREKNKVDIQVFQNVIQAYFKSQDKQLTRLLDYAKRMKLEDKVRMYIEVFP